MKKIRLFLPFALALSAAACELVVDFDRTKIPAEDAGTPDATAPTDSGVTTDSGAGTDSGAATDSGVTDSGAATDSGVTDSGAATDSGADGAVTDGG